MENSLVHERDRLTEMIFVDIDRHIRIDQLFVRFAKGHVVSPLEVGGPQAAGLAQLDADRSREHHHVEVMVMGRCWYTHTPVPRHALPLTARSVNNRVRAGSGNGRGEWVRRVFSPRVFSASFTTHYRVSACNRMLGIVYEVMCGFTLLWFC